MKNHITLFDRIYRLKLLLVGALLLILGLLAAALGDWLSSNETPHLAIALVNGLSDVLLVTGSIGIAVDFFTGRERDAADEERVRRLLKESAPDFRDAVVRGFAVTPEDLKRVATPELLDGIATNVLGLRLGDQQFASEIYAELRDQAIRAPERWHDVEVRIRLSEAQTGHGAIPLFDVLVEWEYTVIPSHPIQRFACVSDRDEMYELINDVPATSTWFMTPRPGIDATQRESFELLYFSVEGVERSIRRSTRKSGQTYSATIGQDVVEAGEPVRIKHIYRAVTAQSTHRLFVEIAQPARGVSLELDYSDTTIARLSVADLVTSTQKPRVTQLPEEVAGRALSIDVPGWLLPKAGFTFVWTLESEELPSRRGGRPAPGARALQSR